MGNLTHITKFILLSGLTMTASKSLPNSTANRYKQAMKKKKKKNISLTHSLQYDSFIARGQGQENKNLVFFPTALKRKKELQTHKARVMQATQTTAPPKLTLHLLSANTHKKNIIINC